MPKTDALKLEEAFSSLKTPEAKATVIYSLSKKTIEEFEHRSEKETGYSSDFPRKGIIPLSFPVSLNDGTRQAVALAFKDHEWRLGFSIAAQGGILEQLVAQVEGIPIPERKWGRQREEERLPETIKQLPGYQPPEKYATEDIWEVVHWAQNMNAHLVKDVLVPSGRYIEAAHQLVKIGDTDGAFILAGEHLEPEQIAELCEKAQTDFGTAIEAAKGAGKKDLEDALKEKQIKSILQGKHRRIETNPARWKTALSLAREYNFDGEKINAILHEAAESLTSAFEKELSDWRQDLDKIQRERYSDRDEGYSPSRRVGQSRWERERDLEDARSRYIGRPTEAAAELIDLIKELPQEEAAKTRKRLLDICSNSSFDGFGIAVALGDVQKAISYGTRLMRNLGGHSRGSPVQSISATLQNRVLPQADQEQRMDFVRALNSLAEHHGDWDSPERVARQYGLTDWLIEELGSSKPWAAAEIAVNSGQKDKARKLFVKSEQYGRAIELTDNPLEKAALSFRIAEKQIEDRARYPLLTRGPDKFNGELDSMQKALDWFNGSGLEAPSPEYVERASKVIEVLFSNGDYVEGCLFAKTSGLTKEQYRALMTPERLEDAEKRQDFAACYHLARLQGRSDAPGYKIIAKQLGQKVPVRLGDLAYKQPKTRSGSGEVREEDSF